MNVADPTRLGDHLSGPHAGMADVDGLTGAQKVLRDHREVLGRARGHEQDGVALADAADLADRGLGAIQHAAELLAAMAMLEQPDARAIEIPDGLLRAAQDLLRKRGRARREVELPHREPGSAALNVLVIEHGDRDAMERLVRGLRHHQVGHVLAGVRAASSR